MDKLQNGDVLRSFSLKATTGETIHLPQDIPTDYAIILFYRGHWCPFCRRLLNAYEERIDQFKEIGTSLFAASVDPLDKAQEVAATVSFPIDWGVTRELGDKPGSFWEDRRNIIQPTEFIVNGNGLIYASTYSSSPVGRIDPEEALAAIRF